MKKKTKTKNNKKNANLPKFAWGGTAFSYESPQETQARLAKQAILNLVDYENDPTSKFLDGLGGALAGTGLSMIAGGIGKAGGLSSILGKNGGTSKVGGILDGILGTGSDSSGGGLLGNISGLLGGGGNGIGGAIGQGIGTGVGLLGNVLGDGQKKQANSELKQTLNALQSGGSKKTSDLMQEDRNKYLYNPNWNFDSANSILNSTSASNPGVGLKTKDLMANDRYKKFYIPNLTFYVGGEVPIEAEHGEIVQEPTGEMYELDGATHEEGGIPLEVPGGTEIFSDRLIGADGNTMAQRKKNRENRLAKIQKELNKFPDDASLKKTLRRVQKQNAFEEQLDMQLMQQAQQAKMLAQQEAQLAQQQQAQAQGGEMGQEGSPEEMGLMQGLEQGFDPSMMQGGGEMPVEGEVPQDVSQEGMYEEVPQEEFAVGGRVSRPGNIPGLPAYLLKDLPGMIEQARGNTPLVDTGNPDDVVYTAEDEAKGEKTIPEVVITKKNKKFTPVYVGKSQLSLTGQNNLMNSINANSLATGPKENITPVAPLPGNQNTNSNSTNTSGNSEFNFEHPFKGMTLGDAIGMYANHKAPQELMKNTIDQYRYTPEEINHFKNYGREALKTLRGQAGLIDTQHDLASQNLQLSRNAMNNLNNNSARGINTLRALNMASNAQTDAQQRELDMARASQMLSLGSQIAQQQNAIDQMVMKGDEERANRNLQNQDNYFTNMAKNISTKYQSLAKNAEALNEIKKRNAQEKLIGRLYRDFEGDKDGNIKAKYHDKKEDPKTKMYELDRTGKDPKKPEAKTEFDTFKFDREGRIAPEEIKKIEETPVMWKHRINPKTGKAFESAQEFAEQLEFYNKNKDILPSYDEYLGQEVSTEYKKYYNPKTGNKFASMDEYERFKSPESYYKDKIREWRTITDAAKKLGNVDPKHMDTLERIINLDEAGIGKSLDLSNKEDVKLLQKLAGVTADGVIGKKTLAALSNLISGK
jgi:os07g0440100 protein|uniref:Secretion activator protein, putative, Secretion activator, Porphyromonas gingivalis.3A n=1 Tax=Podoviridae sp. ctQyH19 TaxID=2825249 RepID=A0A8S5UQX1_9CAUD|nr:MAG TPA: Secretion activator protein, putative, Secretion activator, Porphyromonas gingivalis.3A [Podoviridae sp. ctQyH19]